MNQNSVDLGIHSGNTAWSPTLIYGIGYLTKIYQVVYLAFNVEKMTEFAVAQIRRFSEKHNNETFYAFAIDASLLCLNSEEEFSRTLATYRRQSPERYSDIKNVECLRSNTGDWAYLGFADFRDCDGFDNKQYQKHYNIGLSLGENQETDYGLAMDAVIKGLLELKAFKTLRRTSGFAAFRREHTY